MSAELESKAELPAEVAVLVCEVRPGGLLQPVVSIYERSDGAVKVLGRFKAPLALGPLERALAQVREVTLALAESPPLPVLPTAPEAGQPAEPTDWQVIRGRRTGWPKADAQEGGAA